MFVRRASLAGYRFIDRGRALLLDAFATVFGRTELLTAGRLSPG